MIFDTTRLRRLFGLLESGRPVSAEAPVAGVVISKEGGPRVVWPTPTRAAAAHSLVLAASGAGKTVVVSYATAVEFAESLSADPASAHCVIIIDPKGDLALHVPQALAAISPSALDRLTILNPFSDDGFEFNLNHLRTTVPLDIRALQLAALVSQVSTGVGSQKHLGVGARQMDVLQHVLLGALATERPGASLLLALDALTEPNGFRDLAGVTSSRRAQSFLSNTELTSELQSSTASRLRTALAATEQLERLIGAPGCIDIEALCGPGQILIIDLGRPPGGIEALITFWGNLVLRQFVDHLLSRPSPWPGHAARLLCDEAQRLAPVLSDVSETILTTGRSRAISQSTMTQTLSLLQRESPELVRCLEANVPFKLVGRLAAPDAELLSRELTNAPGVDETRNKVRERFVSTVTNLPDRIFIALTPGNIEKFETIEVDMAAWEEAANTHRDALLRAERRFAVPEGARPRARLGDLQPSRNDRRGGQQNAAPRRGPPRSRWG